MRIWIPLIFAGLVAAPAVSVETSRDAAKLAAVTKERTPGAALDCIDRQRSGDFSVAGRHAIFRVSSDLIYVNEMTPGCDIGLGRQALVFRSTSSRLCRGDIAEAVDPRGGAAGGSCALGQFVPYTRN